MDNKRLIASILAVATAGSVFMSGCSVQNDTIGHDEANSTPIITPFEQSSEQLDVGTITVTPAPSQVPDPTPTPANESLTVTQKNSINMLNYLAALTARINSSKNSRVFLEEAYTELINNTDPSVVDSITLGEYESILDTLESYRMLSVKRERLLFMYEQNRASAMRSALPNPLAVLSVVQSSNPLKAVASVVYMAVDSVNSYTSHTDETDMQYLQDGWSLDDEEAEYLHNTRKNMFSYMVRIVRDNDIPGSLSLNETAVTDFVKWANEPNVARKIQFLEANESTYKSFGEYWLELASSYYENEDYSKCLEAVKIYKTLDNQIFRKDYKLAEIIPSAVIAAKETMSTQDYLKYADENIKLLLLNSNSTDWVLRYFAAQVYMELYANTQNKKYIENAFEITLDSVNNLIDEQEMLNAAYLADIVEEVVPENATKAEEKEIKNYNKLIKEERKVAVPPVYEPLRLNCDLLFGLAEELNISDYEKSKIDSILHYNNEALFLDSVLDNEYRFNSTPLNEKSIDIEFDGNTIVVPATYVSEESRLRVMVNDTVIEDWIVKKVDRNKSSDVNDFAVTYTSNAAKKLKYTDGDVVTVEIKSAESSSVDPIVVTFRVEITKIWKASLTTKFVRI